MRSLGIRWRLTLWYGGILAFVLLCFSGLTYMMMRHLPLTDEPLRSELNELAHMARNARNLNAVHEACQRYLRRREGYRFQVRTKDGTTVFRSERLGPYSLPMPEIVRSNGGPVITDHRIPGIYHLRVASREVPGPDGPLIVQAALSMAPYDQQLWRLQAVLMIMVPLSLACALGGGYLLARKALAPMDEMVATASKITAMDLNRRITVGNGKD